MGSYLSVGECDTYKRLMFTGFISVSLRPRSGFQWALYVYISRETFGRLLKVPLPLNEHYLLLLYVLELHTDRVCIYNGYVNDAAVDE
jgi:hypothetical protein